VRWFFKTLCLLVLHVYSFLLFLLKGLRVFWMSFFEKNVLSSTWGLRSTGLLFVIPWKRMTWELRVFGLGIEQILKYVWRLHSERSSVLLGWVHNILFRGRSFLHVRLPSVSSWSWKKILLSKDWCRGKFVSCIGDEKTINLRLNHWLPDGQQFYDLFPFKMLTSTGLSWDAMFSASLRRVIGPFHLVIRSINLLGTQFIFTPRVPYQTIMYGNVILQGDSPLT
jgi:hypothetical protein